jgi:thiamine-phosphate pyrophosphorylase
MSMVERLRATRLCAIVDVEVAERAGWSPVDLAAAYIRGGARFLQVRAKSRPSGAFLDVATAVTRIAQAAGAIVVVNDRADIAKLAGASGVHLGQDDLTPAAARAILGGRSVVGLSTHTEPQVGRAILEPVTYLASGPLFGTSTKATGYEPVGLERVRYAAALAHPHELGVVAIGGITLDRAPAVIEAGADAVAVITDLLATGDPEARVRAYLERLR